MGLIMKVRQYSIFLKHQTFLKIFPAFILWICSVDGLRNLSACLVHYSSLSAITPDNIKHAFGQLESN